jgi:guanine nucleotide-binding protein subunit alpha
LFQEISNHPILKPVALILFLNKVDLLEQKLKNNMSPIGRYCPDYKGKEADVEAGRAYFASKFRSLHQATKTKTPFYIHFTTATNTTLLDVTMKTVQLSILQHNFHEVLSV